MDMARIHRFLRFLRFLPAIAACAVLSGTQGRAEELSKPVRFAAPRRILAGDAFVGAGRLYPSPVMHDVDGDGSADLVVADLFGRVTFARRTAGGFAAEQPLNDRDGQPLNFHNW